MDDIGRKIDAKVEESQDKHPRPHLGASLLGHYCDRYIWLSFRWAITSNFSGRILRLFRRGQDEETKVIEWLELIGFSVDGSQARVDFGSHVSGSCDGIVNGEAVLEIKTHNRKSFEQLSKEGVRTSKTEHYTQMQAYMKGLGLTKALYFAVCKDDDRIYTQWIDYDDNHATAKIEKAKRIALSDESPATISNNPSWYRCKMCDAHDICHGSKETKKTNCRTCAWSTALADSTWRCEKNSKSLDFIDQVLGCEEYERHPHMTPEFFA